MSISNRILLCYIVFISLILIVVNVTNFTLVDPTEEFKVNELLATPQNSLAMFLSERDSVLDTEEARTIRIPSESTVAFEGEQPLLSSAEFKTWAEGVQQKQLESQRALDARVEREMLEESTPGFIEVDADSFVYDSTVEYKSNKPVIEVRTDSVPGADVATYAPGSTMWKMEHGYKQNS